MLIATNATTVDHLFMLAGGARRDALVQALSDRVAAIAVGPVTAAAFEAHGVPVAAMPREPHTGELLRSLVSWRQRRVDEGAHGAPAPALRMDPRAGVVHVGERAVGYRYNPAVMAARAR